MNERVVLVDGSALVYRAFFAIPPHLTTKDGTPTNAVFGFATMFKKLFAAKTPRYGAVVFDPPGKTTRDEQFADYKAQREAMPDELRKQLPLIDRVVDAHRFPRLRVAGYEADDVIGTLARMSREAGHDVVIISSDKDFAQLIGDGVRMQDTLKDVTYDDEIVRKKWGVRPNQIVDLLALMGDAADNIPGVDGIGQKGAVDLLSQFASLEDIYRALDETPAALKPRMQKVLQTGRDAAWLSHKLATIDTHAPIGVTLDDIAIGAADGDAVNALYRELDFFSLLGKEEGALARQAAQTSAAATPSQTANAAAVSLSALWQAPDDVVAVSALLANEDDGAGLRAQLFGIAFASPHGTRFVPIDEDAMFPADVAGYLQDEARQKVVHDDKMLRNTLSRHSVTLRGVVFDTRLASFLVDPTRGLPHHLESVTKEILQRLLAEQTELTGTGKNAKSLADVDSDAVAAFAVERARTVLALYAPLSAQLDATGQRNNMVEVDLPLSRVLADMERTGIAVDAKQMIAVGAELRVRLADIEKQVFTLAGRELNLGSPKQLGELLFEQLQLPVVKRTKSGYSTDAEVLEKLTEEHEIPRLLLEHRKLDKLINTYVDVLSKDVDGDGRVHATFQQTTSATGRLITTEPDLQRTPTKSVEGKRIRACFVARPLADGTPCVLVDVDWSQIELRLLAHMSGDPLLVESFQRGDDVHRRTAAQIFAKPESDITKSERDVGKTVNFATIYGQGATALGQQLKVPRKTAQAWIAAYFAAYAGVARFVEDSVKKADAAGYAETLLGRRRIIRELKSKSHIDRAFGERVAVNTPIQGSAADICKLAMLRIAEKLPTVAPRARMLLQVHDELVFECPTDEADAVAALAKDVMEHVVQLAVPLVADAGIGASWAAAKDG